MTAAPRKILIVNTADRGGGAEVVAMAALDGFDRRGSETWMAVGRKETDHPRVVECHASPHSSYLRSKRSERGWELRRRLEAAAGLEAFAYPDSRRVLGLAGSPPDVVFCGNLHGGFFDLTQLPALCDQVPVVMRLADSWALTGHCACPGGCERWATGCGRCPDLSLPPASRRDATALNWRRKRRLYARSRIFLVTPSRWLLERAQRSMLAPAIAASRVVPNGVDLGVFSPGDRRRARAELGIDPAARVLLYVANGGTENPTKDFATLRAAVAQLESPGAPLALIVVGADGPSEPVGVAVLHRRPWTGSRAEMVRLYRAADVYVHAAREEAFCLAAAEAMACGLPVVAAAGGGIAELVADGQTGLVTSPGDPGELAAALSHLLADAELRERLGAQGARRAVEHFDQERMLDGLHAWCGEAAETSTPSSTATGARVSASWRR